LTTFTQIRNTANYRKPILMCGKATGKTDSKYRRPPSTYRRPILCDGKAT